MKCFSVYSLICVFSHGANLKTLEEVYGVMPKVHSMVPRTPAGDIREPVYDLYKSVRLPENCIFPLDIVIVQDATDSFSDDYEQMSKVQLPMMLEVLSETHPGSEFSLVSFKDKPILPFGIPPTTENGYYSDYCAHIESHLTANLSAVIERYESSHPMGGGDPSENQFHALLGATQAEGIKWPNNPDRAQLLVLVTDAPPHFEDDGSDPQGMRPSTGTFDEANVDIQCVTEFYPNPEQVKASIMQRNAYTAFLIYDPEYMEGLVGRSWLWFNRFINQTDEFITLQAENSSDFWTKLAGIIGIIEDIECLPQSSTVVPTQPQTSAEVTPSQTPPARAL